MADEPRIRDLYQQYKEGRIPFEQVVRAADRVLERFEAERGSTQPTESRTQATGSTQRD